MNYETENLVYVIKLKRHSGSEGIKNLIDVRKLKEQCEKARFDG